MDDLPLLEISRRKGAVPFPFILTFICQVSIFLVGDHTVLFIEPTASGVSDQISNRIYYAGSKLRLNNARYLVRVSFQGEIRRHNA